MEDFTVSFVKEHVEFVRQSLQLKKFASINELVNFALDLLIEFGGDEDARRHYLRRKFAQGEAAVAAGNYVELNSSEDIHRSLEACSAQNQPRTYPVLDRQNASFDRFVEYWEARYTLDNEAWYEDNIGDPFTDKSRELLFMWKNGGPLSARKSKSIRDNYGDSSRISFTEDRTVLREYLLKPGGAIWRIFWLHVQHPLHFPIYDQHVHRAMADILEFPHTEIAVKDADKVDAYLDRYVPFVRSLEGYPIRKIDRAMWTFGKTLKSKIKLLNRQVFPGIADNVHSAAIATQRP